MLFCLPWTNYTGPLDGFIYRSFISWFQIYHKTKHFVLFALGLTTILKYIVRRWYLCNLKAAYIYIYIYIYFWLTNAYTMQYIKTLMLPFCTRQGSHATRESSAWTGLHGARTAINVSAFVVRRPAPRWPAGPASGGEVSVACTKMANRPYYRSEWPAFAIVFICKSKTRFYARFVNYTARGTNNNNNNNN